MLEQQMTFFVKSAGKLRRLMGVMTISSIIALPPWRQQLGVFRCTQLAENIPIREV